MKRELTHGSLFSGVGGFGLGAALAGIKTEWSCEFEKYQTEVIKKKILEMDTQYMEILERLKTRHLLTSSAVDSLVRTSALLEKAQELREQVWTMGAHAPNYRRSQTRLCHYRK